MRLNHCQFVSSQSHLWHFHCCCFSFSFPSLKCPCKTSFHLAWVFVLVILSSLLHFDFIKCSIIFAPCMFSSSSTFLFFFHKPFCFNLPIDSHHQMFFHVCVIFSYIFLDFIVPNMIPVVFHYVIITISSLSLLYQVFSSPKQSVQKKKCMINTDRIVLILQYSTSELPRAHQHRNVVSMCF